MFLFFPGWLDQDDGKCYASRIYNFIVIVFLFVYLHFNLEVYRLEVMTEKLDWNIGFSVEHTPICICCYQLFSLDLRYWKKKLHHGYPGHREAEITVVTWSGLVPFYFLSLCVKLMCTIHISSEGVISCWVSKSATTHTTTVSSISRATTGWCIQIDVIMHS